MKRQYLGASKFSLSASSPPSHRTLLAIANDLFKIYLDNDSWLRFHGFNTIIQCPICCKYHKYIKSLIPCIKRLLQKENPQIFNVRGFLKF